ncbi:MAG: hypothetical protein QM741_10215 [Rudaea sp.]|uniref:hypothetical protein n=1 Tax=Rudaea sp. TaxID=2136325 RepID=UPI0039E2FACB
MDEQTLPKHPCAAGDTPRGFACQAAAQYDVVTEDRLPVALCTWLTLFITANGAWLWWDRRRECRQPRLAERPA